MCEFCVLINAAGLGMGVLGLTEIAIFVIGLSGDIHWEVSLPTYTPKK